MRTFFAVLIALPLVAASGCASTSNSVRSSNVPPAQTAYVYERNEAYIARVEAIAARRGVAIEWVNPPQIKVTRAPPARSNRDG